MIAITTAEFRHADANFDGFCLTCEEFTRSQCEPDAERYPCPECDGLTVYGAIQALLIGAIEIKGAESDA